VKRRGLVTARHRRELVIETDDGDALTALARGRKLKALTGDHVLCNTEADGTVVVEEILPRRSLLERIDSRGHSEGVAANLTVLVIVVAPHPAPDWGLVDRYLVAASLSGIDAAIVRNKTDIEDSPTDDRLEVYRTIGYPIIATNPGADDGIAELAALLHDQRGVLLGQSGVGKSSLLNALLRSDAQAVGALSRRRQLGRHTTTAAVLHRLPGGGELIDSPGVRRYAPGIAGPSELASGFVEFRPYLGRCRFNDCRHASEPGCAVIAAVGHGAIARERFESFTTLRAALASLAQS
jgi:ribosome biogenesis GTPase